MRIGLRILKALGVEAEVKTRSAECRITCAYGPQAPNAGPFILRSSRYDSYQAPKKRKYKNLEVSQLASLLFN